MRKLEMTDTEIDRVPHGLPGHAIEKLRRKFLAGGPRAGRERPVAPDRDDQDIADLPAVKVLEAEMPGETVGQHVQPLPAIAVQQGSGVFRRRRTTTGLPQPAHLSDQLSPLRVTASLTCHSQTA
jgi:hypothetical protein